MPQEAQGLFEKLQSRVIYTGIGKINAAYHLTKAIKEAKPKLVINFGTAGSRRFKTCELVECHQFVQRDMDLTGIGFAAGVTPFDKIGGTIEFAPIFEGLATGVCGTGDSFEMAESRVPCDVVEMEAYALAKICKLEGIAFSAVKFISDGSDHDAHNDWAENLPKAARAFKDLFDNARK